MSAVWIVASCAVLLGGGGVWAAWPLMWPLIKFAPDLPDRGEVPVPGIAEHPRPKTGAHWLDGWVVFGNTYL
ncbi:hypothetical protein [Arthrobacter sp. NicSoilB8]|jgi:hypothetical protein|uniref:hypothetical protein n=1 Tax=Arthrobacter sp. NicSoilB8 TaxID=2830998 RepID=UPI001CC5A834|nr:hypothetical protein [Arthrobacter sp. NicSoilB8]BCW71378.1 hypothetical protein NicSoilB8_24220 [Arthrobacter sp. NicSoilB8]